MVGASEVPACLMIKDALSLLRSVFTAQWLTAVAKRLLGSAWEGKLFLLLDKVQRDLRDFAYYLTFGLEFDDPCLRSVMRWT